MNHWQEMGELKNELIRLKQRLESIELHYERNNSDDYGAWLREFAAVALDRPAKV